jgi:hypothetical protein
MMELLSSPTFVALIQAAGVGLLVILAAVSQRYGTRKESAPPTSKDVVVQSLTIADNAAISRLAETLHEANRLIRDRSEFERNMLFEAETANALLNDIKHILARPKRQEAID